MDAFFSIPNFFQQTVDPGSDDSQIDDAIIVLKAVVDVNVCDVRERLVEFFNFLVFAKVSPKQKVTSAFVVAAFPTLFEQSATGDGDLAHQLKSALLTGSFPVNLMSDVVRMLKL